MFTLQRRSLEKAHELLSRSRARALMPYSEYLTREQRILIAYYDLRGKERSENNRGLMWFVLTAIAIEAESGTLIPTVTKDMVHATINEWIGDTLELTRQWELHYAKVQPFLVPFIESVTFPHMGGAPPTPDLRLGALQDVFLMLRPFEK